MLGDLPDGSGIADGDAAAGDPRGGSLGAALATSGGGTGSIATTGAGPGAAPHGGPGTSIAQQVGQHLGEAMRAGPGGGRLDVTLQPEDLGRLRLVFTPSESGLTVAVSADRPETLDLLRRNIDLLAGDLAQQGFTDVAFQFGTAAGGGGGSGDAEGSSATPLRVDVGDGDSMPGGAMADAMPGGTAGLDLRL